ncbi:general transcription factor IIH subunit 4-like [Corapipo altera]|uniref:general transcription factor IIH subunit 4-like n=1 Tax=Corapipo altera TaxID=415028 RepID=UPI000FD626FF|nr:general transcription factor IIH subunit 4-like [Corapipo altera]
MSPTVPWQRKSRRFYPTRLAIALASGTSGTVPEPDGHGFVLVETNYRIYAYTDSELQVALIALFSELLYRFPNLVVAQVTRDSVQAAIANGITADQVWGHWGHHWGHWGHWGDKGQCPGCHCQRDHC